MMILDLSFIHGQGPMIHIVFLHCAVIVNFIYVLFLLFYKVEIEGIDLSLLVKTNEVMLTFCYVRLFKQAKAIKAIISHLYVVPSRERP